MNRDQHSAGSEISVKSATISAETLRAVLTAYSVGDAMGMPTEFMTRAEIHSKFGLVDRLLEPGESKNHPNIPRASVTDDTEQVLTLLDEYTVRGRVDAHDTALRLLRWMRESGAIEKRYIGPSSKAALEAIERGTAIERAGLGGTTCGGVMRSPAAVLFAEARGLPLAACVRDCLVPTHFSALALGPAMAYAYALHAAIRGEGVEKILSEAEVGEADGLGLAPSPQCGPSVAARVRIFRECAASSAVTDKETDAALNFIYSVFGTTLASADVAAAALCIFLVARDDVWLAIRMGASVGGDTDTIAALSGALSAAHALATGGSLNIPDAIVREVLEENGLDFDALLCRLVARPQGL
jgi:ADP-ribosylglycohydrolase